MIRSEFVKGYAEKAAENLRDKNHCSNDKDEIVDIIRDHMMRLLLDMSGIQ